MKILKVINNNVVSALDESGEEIVVMGKGVGFAKNRERRLMRVELRRGFFWNIQLRKKI